MPTQDKLVAKAHAPGNTAKICAKFELWRQANIMCKYNVYCEPGREGSKAQNPAAYIEYCLMSHDKQISRDKTWFIRVMIPQCKYRYFISIFL